MARKKKSRLPKRIAGVKVPKSLRKGSLGDVLGSSAGQAAIAITLFELGRNLTKEKDAAEPRLGLALGEGVRAFREALHHRPDSESLEPDWADRPAEPGFRSTGSALVGSRAPLDLVSAPAVVRAMPRSSLVSKLKALALSSAGGLARRRAARDLKALDRAQRGAPQQTLRAFIQVNVHPRPH